MKFVCIRLNVLSKSMKGHPEETDFVANQIQSITDTRIAGLHFLSWIQLKGNRTPIPVLECSELIKLLIEFAEIEDWHKRPSSFWNRWSAIWGDPRLDLRNPERETVNPQPGGNKNE